MRFEDAKEGMRVCLNQYPFKPLTITTWRLRMSSTQHSEEAWAVEFKAPKWKTWAYLQTRVKRVPDLFSSREDTLRDVQCLRGAGYKARSKRVRISTIGHKVKCCQCSAEATFDSPRNFCDKHWARWWATDKGKVNRTMYREAISTIGAKGRKGKR